MYVYMFYLVNKKPTKNKLLDHVVPHVTPYWYDLGIKLLKEEEEAQLDVIESNYADDKKECCKRMFWYWLSTNTDASWQQLIEALQSSAIKLPVVAADIEKMLKGRHACMVGANYNYKLCQPKHPGCKKGLAKN